ncbi:hypothetical protein IMY05_013G0112800 [Salix suchowensis]|nr:hypothetical protein IMY05_013G0112800 [Salix suchowensis]
MDDGLLLPVFYKKVKGAPCSSTQDQSFEARQLPRKKISGFHRENSDDASFRTLGAMLTKK